MSMKLGLHLVLLLLLWSFPCVDSAWVLIERPGRGSRGNCRITNAFPMRIRQNYGHVVDDAAASRADFLWESPRRRSTQQKRQHQDGSFHKPRHKRMSHPEIRVATTRKTNGQSRRSLWSSMVTIWSAHGVASVGPSSAAVAAAVEPLEDETISPSSSARFPTNQRRRPYAATVEALVPAMKVRSLLNRAQELLVKAVNRDLKTDSDNDNSAVLTELRALFDDGSSRSKKMRMTLTTSTTTLSDWITLDHLSGPLVRLALNIYTANLRYSDSYVLTASPALRKQLIRSDAGLPDVKTVVTADLDLRDLYRNALQTTVDDIQAELLLLVSSTTLGTGGSTDLLEVNALLVQALLVQAQEAMTSWLALIDETDVQEATDKLQELTLALAQNNARQ